MRGAVSDDRPYRDLEILLLLTEFIVVTRAAYPVPSVPGATVHLLDSLNLESSSSAIRAALARGERPADVPSAVLDYIAERDLYR